MNGISVLMTETQADPSALPPRQDKEVCEPEEGLRPIMPIC